MDEYAPTDGSATVENTQRASAEASVAQDDQVPVPSEPSQIVPLDDLRRGARVLNDEMSSAACFVRDTYQTGYIRFTPGDETDPTFITHADLDVVCLVLNGRGRLRYGPDEEVISVGDLVRIPAGAPHDFSAIDQPLELLYTTIRVS